MRKATPKQSLAWREYQDRKRAVAGAKRVKKSGRRKVPITLAKVN